LVRANKEKHAQLAAGLIVVEIACVFSDVEALQLSKIGETSSRRAMLAAASGFLLLPN
jgi:hypothetical protein